MGYVHLLRKWPKHAQQKQLDIIIVTVQTDKSVLKQSITLYVNIFTKQITIPYMVYVLTCLL